MTPAVLLQAYDGALEANSALDSAYYENPNPTSADHADYHRRMERMDRLRECVYGAVSTGYGITARKRLRHTLCNQLNVILGYADLLAKASSDPRTREGLSRIRTTAIEMADVIKSSLP